MDSKRDKPHDVQTGEPKVRFAVATATNANAAAEWAGEQSRIIGTL